MIVEDRTKKVTVKDLEQRVIKLEDFIEKFSGEVSKALSELSKNDEKVISQVKDALEEITKKVILLDRKLELLSNVFENVMIGEGEVKKLDLHEYKDLVTKLK